MHELVNTSLPNGLIPGTHGFATVAMTKGIPDNLRSRLEAFCSYAHRTSAHDDTYYRENPVNWFHAILSQGEHVAGRVAPCDFDYTGRTNRLARLRIFKAGEMPGAGAAEILVREKEWFAQSWQGEARYLEEDSKTCGELRMLNPVQTSSASAWEAIFGANGTRYAQQIAWQLEKNLASGGKSIYFKTSTVWDVSGEKLLALFADVINLLPVSQRLRVTFSTYPASLPGGTQCSLRGIYDRDKFFDTISATQAWIDCENGKIVHAELLPSEDPSKKEQPALSVQRSVKNHETVSVSRRNTLVQNTSAHGVRQPSLQGQILPEKHRPDKFVLSLLIATVIAIVAFAGVVCWFLKPSTPSIVLNAQTGDEYENDISDANQSSRPAGPGEQANGSPEPPPNPKNEEAVAIADNPRKKEMEEAKRKAKEEAEQEAKRIELETVQLEKRNIEFLDAKEILLGVPMRKGSLGVSDANSFVADDDCRVYYYNQGILTNEIAGIEIKKYGATQSGVLKYGERLKKNEDSIPSSPYGFVLWYNPKHKRVYIDLKKRAAPNEDDKKWFAKTNEVDLAFNYFGPDDNLRKLWEKYRNGESTKYLVSWKYTEKCRSRKQIETTEPKLTVQFMIEEIKKKEIEDFDDKIQKAKNEKAKWGKELESEDKHPEIDKLNNEITELKKILSAWEKCDKRISEIDNELKDNKKQNEKNDKRKERQDLKKKRDKILAEGVPEPTGETVKGKRRFQDVDTLRNEIKRSESKLAEENIKHQKRKDELNEEIDKANAEIIRHENEKKEYLVRCTEDIKAITFELHVAGESKEAGQ